MEMVLYADVLFLIDFSMDFLSLYGAGRLLSLCLSAARMSAAAAVGALYGVLATAWQFGGLPGAVGVFLCSVLMSLIAFGRSARPMGYLSRSFAVWGIGTLLGGGMTALGALFDGTLPGGGPLELLAVAAAAAGGFGRLLRRRMRRGYGEISFRWNGGEYESRALIDSGNLLTDPLSGLPVVLITRQEARLFAGEEAERLFMGDVSGAVPGGLRVIPRRRGEERELLYGFLCPRLRIRSGWGEEERRAVIAVDPHAEDFDGCGALLPASLIS